MTPEERAELLVDGLGWETRLGDAEQAIASAIREAVASEREACAKVVESDANPCPECGLGEMPDYRARQLAAAIRAR